MRPNNACAKPRFIYISYILIYYLFFNPNVFLPLKILHEIIFIKSIFTLYYKQLLFPSVKLSVKSKKLSGLVFAYLR